MAFNVVAKSRLAEFWKHHSRAQAPMEAWHAVVSHAKWKTFAELKVTYGTADSAGPFVVFDIGGNKYRIIADVWFAGRFVYIKHVFTHAEYDKWWKKCLRSGKWE
jgi:mRNA interferase HigB